jgi:hypothetical protein
MKKTINNTNKYFSTAKKKEKMIINAVYSSAKVEGSKTTKKELKEHYKNLYKKFKLKFVRISTISSSITRRT